MPSTEMILLLVGTSGVGKSAVGNAILGENVFESLSSCDSVTKEISIKSRKRNDFHLTVVDTPGLFDVRLGIDEANVKAYKNMKRAMQMCPRNGELAVIFVIKYGVRHTEHKNMLHIFENIFGKDNIWKSCLIVMTHGDCYDIDQENKRFYEYLKEQEGDFGAMFANCNYKCVLFHNKTKIIEQQEKEFQILLNGVNSLQQGLTRGKFEEVFKEQNRLELESLLPTLKAKFEMEVNRLNSILQEIKLNLESSDALEKLEDEIRQNFEHAEKEDSPTKIYYKKGEPRFLEDIRMSFKKTLELICIKKNKLRQMKLAHEINNEIENIKMEIIQTDPQDKEISILLQSFTEKILNTTKLMENPDFTIEDKTRIQLSIDDTSLELEKLKMKAENLEAYYLNDKIDSIIQRLNTIDITDTDANELLLSLKYETETFKSSLKNAVKSLKTIQCGIIDKIESVRQFQFENSFNIQKEKLIKEIDEAYAKRQGDYKFVCDIIERLTNLKESLQNEPLNKDAKDRLELSI